MGEHGYMEDAEFTLEDDIQSLFTVKSAYMTIDEIIEELSVLFNLSKERIESIVNSDIKSIETETTKIDYLTTLTTTELDRIYSVLARQGKSNPNADIMNKIELITIKRNNANE